MLGTRAYQPLAMTEKVTCVTATHTTATIFGESMTIGMTQFSSHPSALPLLPPSQHASSLVGILPVRQVPRLTRSDSLDGRRASPGRVGHLGRVRTYMLSASQGGAVRRSECALGPWQVKAEMVDFSMRARILMCIRNACSLLSHSCRLRKLPMA